MNLHVIGVGRLKEPYLRDAQAEYRKRLRSYCNLTVTEAKAESGLLAAIPERAVVVAVDERGKALSSREFATSLLASHAQHGSGNPLVFVIGGPDGHSDVVRQRAKHSIAFGRMTIAHRLIRLVLLEQIYRGFRIVRGEPYHRD